MAPSSEPEPVDGVSAAGPGRFAHLFPDGWITAYPAAMDVQTRRLRCFIVVAEELHFSRAAKRLFMAQQALSRQIRELEDTLGTELLTRTTRRVELTPAGAAYLDAVRRGLAELDGGAAAARRLGRSDDGVLRVGFSVGAALELTVPLLAEFERLRPDVEVVLQEVPLTDPSGGLSSGISDLAFVRIPQPIPGLEFQPLFTEPMVVAVSARHRLAAQETVTTADLVGERITATDQFHGTWPADWERADDRADGYVPQIIWTTTVTEDMIMVSVGRAVSVSAASAARILLYTGVVYRPIVDVAGSTLAIGYPAGEPGPVAADFLAAARTVVAREKEIVRALEHPFRRPPESALKAGRP